MKNRMKKLCTVVLALTLTMSASICALADNDPRIPKSADGKVYAGKVNEEDKFVSEDILSVGFQVSPKDENGEVPRTVALRMVTTVDSLAYDQVGFQIQITNMTTGKSTLATKTSTKVYKKIKVTDPAAPEYNVTPDCFDNDSQFFATYVITGIPNTALDTYSFTVTPFWVVEGYTVTGVTRSMQLQDAYEECRIANVPVRLNSDQEVAAGYVEVTYDSGTWEYIGELRDAGCTGDGVFQEMEVHEVTPGTVRIVGNVADISENTLADGMLVNLRFQTRTAANTWPDTEFGVQNISFANRDEETVSVPVVQAKYYTFTKTE